MFPHYYGQTFHKTQCPVDLGFPVCRWGLGYSWPDVSQACFPEPAACLTLGDPSFCTLLSTSLSCELRPPAPWDLSCTAGPVSRSHRVPSLHHVAPSLWPQLGQQWPRPSLLSLEHPLYFLHPSPPRSCLDLVASKRVLGVSSQGG